MGRPAAATISVATPERVLAAAESAFSRHGFAATRLADVACEAGIRRSSLLYHFPSKEALYAAVVERAFLRLGAALSAAMQVEGDFETRLEAVTRGFAEFLDEYPAIAPLLVREILDDQGPGHVLILEFVVPLLDEVENFVVREGGPALRPGLPVRAGVVQVASDLVMRASAGSLRPHLWGEGDHAWALARLTFLRDAPSPPES